MAVTDYDSPRRGSLDEQLGAESLDELRASRVQAQSPIIDLDEVDAVDSVELPGADLSGEVLTMPVIPKQPDEFTCTVCYLVQHRSRIASTATAPICIDCV